MTHKMPSFALLHIVYDFCQCSIANGLVETGFVSMVGLGLVGFRRFKLGHVALPGVRPSVSAAAESRFPTENKPYKAKHCSS